APVAGQNFGAHQSDRVKRTFRDGAMMAAGAMFLFAILCQIFPDKMVAVFSKDPAVIKVGVDYLRIVSFTFMPSGIIFVASSMFQAMGNTVPSLISSGVRIILVVAPAFILSRVAGFELRWIWFLSAGAVLIQLTISLLLLRREWARRLKFEPPQSLTEPVTGYASAPMQSEPAEPVL
ncbi:MAG: MATE family efflux transporter, partial [Gemmatimonadales bacterium]